MARSWSTTLRGFFISAPIPATLLLLGLGFSLFPLSQGKFFFYWDNALQHYPETEFLHQALREGELPEWWSQVGLGFPVAAEGQAAHYHPIRLLLVWLLPPPAAFMLEIGLYLAVAGLSTYLFLRQLRLQRSACFVGGLCQMFGSFSVVHINNMALHRSLCLLPLAMFFAERFVKGNRIRNGLGASIVVAFQFLGGHPTFAIVTGVGTGVYIASRIGQQTWHAGISLRATTRQLATSLAPWAAVIVLGFGLAGIQTIPTLFHVEQSIRQGGLSADYATEVLAATPKGLLQLFFPYGYQQGDWLDTPTAWGSIFNTVPYSGIYVGTLSFVLAFLGLWWWRRCPDPGGPLLVCFLLATGFALGGSTPLYPALWSLPGMDGIRYPSRFLLWSSFCLACLAALGLHRLLSIRRLRPNPTKATLPFFTLAGAVLLIAGAFWTRRPQFHSGIMFSLILFALAFLLAWLLLVWRRPSQTGLVLLCIIFLVADLWVFRKVSGYAATVPIRDSLRPPSVARFLQGDGSEYRILSLFPKLPGWFRNKDLRDFLRANTSTIWDIESTDVWASLLLKRYYALHEGISWELSHSADSAERLRGFLGALNVKYVIAPQSVELAGWEDVYREERVAVWRNPLFMPRAYLVGKVEPQVTQVRPEWIDRSPHRLETYRAMISDLNWWTRTQDAHIVDHLLEQPYDFRTSAVVAGSDFPELSGLGAQSVVRRLEQRPDEISFEVQTSKPALLVWANNFYPGWTATVNGNPTNIHRVNWVSMGIFVPEGSSAITFQFSTPGTYWGLIVSLGSLSLLLVGLTARRHRSAELGFRQPQSETTFYTKQTTFTPSGSPQDIKDGGGASSITLSIIIPVYNEASTIDEIVKRVRATPFSKEIIIVDDGSTDATPERLAEIGKSADVRVLHLSKNHGKGAAIQKAAIHVRGQVVVVQDADLEYNPEDYSKLLAPILENRADVVIGSRFSGGGPHRVLFFWHYAGNRFLTLLCNVLSNLNLTDMECGYKAFRSSVLRRMQIQSKRFGFEPEVVIKVAKMGCRIYEVPVSYYGRGYEEGKKITWKDGFRAIVTMIRFTFFP